MTVVAERLEEISRTYTIPLGKAWIAPRHRRSVRVVHMIQEFARKHMKADIVKISPEVNEQVWGRGAAAPPRKITVNISRSEEGTLTVSLPREELGEIPVGAKAEEALEEKPKAEEADRMTDESPKKVKVVEKKVPRRKSRKPPSRKSEPAKKESSKKAPKQDRRSGKEKAK